MPILHHISANSHTCGSDAVTFVGSMSSLEVTLTVCHYLGLLRFCLPKIGGCTHFRSQLVKIFSFDHFWVLLNSKFFQFQTLFLAIWWLLQLIWSGANTIWFLYLIKNKIMHLISGQFNIWNEITASNF